MKIAALALTAFAGMFLASGAHAADVKTIEAARAAVEAAAPEGVRVLDVKLVDQQVHVLGTASDQKTIAKFLGQIEASDEFANPDLEFNYAVKAGGNTFSIIASTQQSMKSVASLQ